MPLNLISYKRPWINPHITIISQFTSDSSRQQLNEASRNLRHVTLPSRDIQNVY